MGARASLGPARPGDRLAGLIQLTANVVGRRHAEPVRSSRQHENADSTSEPQMLPLHDLAGTGGPNQMRVTRNGPDTG